MYAFSNNFEMLVNSDSVIATTDRFLHWLYLNLVLFLLSFPGHI